MAVLDKSVVLAQDIASSAYSNYALLIWRSQPSLLPKQDVILIVRRR